MMPTFGAVNYAASYFTYKTPTPIHGTRTHMALKRLKQELRANSSSVESNLGGDNHRYLGLVLTTAEYAAITPTPIPFQAPNYPAAFTIPNGTDQVATFTLWQHYNKAKRLYYEWKNVKKALQWHIQDAIKSRYMETLVNEDTQLIQEDIPTVLHYLFRN